VDEAVAGSDVVLVLTEWPEFVGSDPAHLAEIAAHAEIIDARNCLDAPAWSAAGWTVRGLGRTHKAAPVPAPVLVSVA
jgi:UDPglucose 6-dehydrogenase